MTKDDAIARLDEIYQGAYAFSIVDYDVIGRTQVHCKCKCGHEWDTIYRYLKHRVSACLRCKIESSRTPYDKVLERLIDASNGRYTFEFTSYTNNKQRIPCKCLKVGCGHKWSAEIRCLIHSKTGCPKCRYRANFDYSNALKVLEELTREKNCAIVVPAEQYLNSKTRVIRQCLSCGRIDFVCLYNAVKHKSGCPNYCGVKKQYVSKGEQAIVDFIKNNVIGLEVEQSVRTLIKNQKGYCLELDIYLPEIKLAFEFNGAYWHSDKMIQQKTGGKYQRAIDYHWYKTLECQKLGITLIHIDERDWKFDSKNVLAYVFSLIYERILKLG